jgi:hypothetical protein
MTFGEFLDQFDEGARSRLAALGFRRARPDSWTRRVGDELQVFWFQKHSSQAALCVNIGAHYAFLPKAGVEAALDGDDIHQVECEIKLRLTTDESTGDQWWPVAEVSVTVLAELLPTRGLTILNRYALAGPVSHLKPGDVESGSLGALSSLTKVRACLLLARLHEHAGDRTLTAEFATLGIKVAGMAVGPKKALRDILQRVTPSA